MKIEAVTENRRRFLPLLLLADPSEAMIDRYLNAGVLFVLSVDGQPATVAVVTVESPTECELKNLATAEDMQGRGYGSQMLRFLFDDYRERTSTMRVGTSEAGVPFYERFGFEYAYRMPDFFTRNYPEPIFENGQQCVDMLVLRRAL